MLFRPSYCCNCGEKIERAEWKLWTSRRFCALCETDFSLQEYAVKGVILLASVISVFGFVRLFTGSTPPELAAKKAIDGSRNTAVVKNAETRPPVQTPLPAANTIEDRTPRTLAALPANVPSRPPVETADAIYICGAATKKGTPCSRRVKGNVRCWQHIGQPAMLPPEQLRAGR